MSKATAIEERRPEAHVEVETPTCRHHWLIETPRGATSHGRCKICGEEREFRNSANDYMWEDESGSSYNAWRGVRSRPGKMSEDDEIAASSDSRQPAMSV